MSSKVCKESISEIERKPNHVKHDLVNDSFASFRKEKCCSSCEKDLPLEAFYSKGNRYDSKCKICVRKTKKDKRVVDKKKREETKKRRKKFRVLDILSYEVVFEGDHSKEALTEIFKSYLNELI
mgnify:FL=1